MKTINTLTEDIYHLFDEGEEHEHSSVLAAEHAMRIGGELAKATQKRDKPRAKGALWASDIGKPCLRFHWFNFNQGEDGEKLDGHTRFKFLYGNILEETVLYFAREAGHQVEELQSVVEYSIPSDSEEGEYWTVRGKIDCVIDGSVVDVKTASTYSFNKYKKEGLNATNDTFGYLWQLAFYKHMGSFEAEGEAGFLFIDKQNGHIHFIGVEGELPTRDQVVKRISDIMLAVEAAKVDDLDRYYSDVPEGKSGNRKLGTECSYCMHKQSCWPGLRTFLYSNKPVFLTHVVREPKVMEVT